MTFRFEPLPDTLELFIQKKKEGNHYKRLLNNLVRIAKRETLKSKVFEESSGDGKGIPPLIQPGPYPRRENK